MNGPSEPLPCPSCRQPMQALTLERYDHGPLSIDVCFACAGIWFDRMESTQLAPAAVIELFKEIHARGVSARQALGAELSCPRCHQGLVLSHDLGKAGPFTYFRCTVDAGRFTPFFQFLREKQFVRSLTEAELQGVRAQVRQVTCSQCGAPIDLETMTVCKYCHAPVAFLDPEAVERAMRVWTQADASRRRLPAPEAVEDTLRGLRLGASVPAPGVLGDRLLLPSAGHDAIDLVVSGILAIGRLLAH